MFHEDVRPLPFLLNNYFQLVTVKILIVVKQKEELIHNSK